MKKILITMMCVIMVIAMMPAMAFAEEVPTGNAPATEEPAADQVMQEEVVLGTETNPYLVGTAAELKEKMEAGGYIKLTGKITLDVDTTITVSGGKTVVLDLNSFEVYGENTRTATHNFLFDAKGGTLTVKNGTITMKHTGNNMGWNGASTVFDVTAGGVLNMDSVVVNAPSETDMNFCVHMNNWGEVTFNATNCTFNSTYCGVRVFNSGPDMNNVTINNSTLTGGTRAFWVHNYASSDFGGKLYSGASATYDEEQVEARLNFEIFDNNNTFSVTGTPTSPIRYGFNDVVYFDAEGNRIYGVTNESSLTEAISKAEAGSTITLQDDINVTLKVVDGKAQTAWTTPVSSDITINLNGHNITGVTEEVTTNGNYMLFMAKGDLEFTGAGTISLEHTGKNMEWNSSSAVVCTDRGNLVIGPDVTIQHKGGTDMSYGLDIYSNANYSPIIDTFGDINSTYIAIRLYNGWEVASNPVSEIINVHSGTIEGVSRAIWAQHFYGGATVNVYDGIIKATGTEKYAIDMAGYNQNEEVASRAKFGMNVNIEGGTITGTATEAFNAVRFAYYDVYEGKTAFNLIGGRFASNPVDYVTNGTVYKFVDGTYEVSTTAPSNTSGYKWGTEKDGVIAEEKIPEPVYIPDPTPVTPAPSTPKDDVVTNETTNTGAAGETVVAPTTNADVSASTTITTTETGAAKTETTVEQTTADKIVESAVANKSEEVVIDATTAPAPTTGTTTPATETTEAAVVIPTQTIETIAEQTDAAVTIKTDVAEIKLDNTAAAAIAEQAADNGTISIVAVKTDEKVVEEETATGETETVTEVHFELKVVCSERGVIGDFQGGTVTVTVPVPEDMHTEELVAVYIDAQGHYHRVTGVKNANGTFTFTTDHFSSYAVMTAEEAEKAIAEQKAKVESVKLKLRSANAKTSKGKKAIKLTVSEVTDTGIDFDGYVIYRSTKKTSGFKKIYTTKTGTYFNTSAKKGVKYYYKAKGFVTIDGEKVYTDWSLKAIRTAK